MKTLTFEDAAPRRKARVSKQRTKCSDTFTKLNNEYTQCDEYETFLFMLSVFAFNTKVFYAGVHQEISDVLPQRKWTSKK